MPSFFARSPVAMCHLALVRRASRLAAEDVPLERGGFYPRRRRLSSEHRELPGVSGHAEAHAEVVWAT
jgi:hypothetical protein